MSSPISLSLMLQLLSAISTVESRNDDLAIGDNGKARGRFQIHEEVVLDVNRVYGTSYIWFDAHDRTKAEWIAFLQLSRYNRMYLSLNPGATQAAQLFVLARFW